MDCADNIKHSGLERADALRQEGGQLWEICCQPTQQLVRVGALYVCDFQGCFSKCVCVCVFNTYLCVFLTLCEWGLPLCVAGTVLGVCLLLIFMATLVCRLGGAHPEKQK